MCIEYVLSSNSFTHKMNNFDRDIQQQERHDSLLFVDTKINLEGAKIDISKKAQAQYIYICLIRKYLKICKLHKALSSFYEGIKYCLYCVKRCYKSTLYNTNSFSSHVSYNCVRCK